MKNKEVIYSYKSGKLGNVKLTKNENIILNELITKDIVSREDLNEITNVYSGSLGNASTICKLRPKVKHLIKIANRTGIGYYIPNKKNIIVEKSGIIDLDKDYFENIFEEYKKAVKRAEDRLYERLEKLENGR